MIIHALLSIMFGIAVPIAMLFAPRILGVRVAGSRGVIFAACVAIAISCGLVLLAMVVVGNLWPDVLYQGEWMTTPRSFSRIVSAIALLGLLTNTLALYLLGLTWTQKTHSVDRKERDTRDSE